MASGVHAQFTCRYIGCALVNRLLRLACSGAFLASLAGCDTGPGSFGPDADAAGHSVPTAVTAGINAAVLDELPFADRQDFEDAKRGLVATEPGLVVEADKGGRVWDMDSFAFIAGEAPPSVNPSLWRQASLNNIHGLFEVTDGVYQLRGYDLANMTLIKGERGWIIVDPLTARETAARAMAFARKHLGDRPVTAILFTHSHVDHFGGALGIVDPADVEQGRVRVIAPEGFIEEATSENVLAGVAMARRSMFMYGKRLDRSVRGNVGNGLGKTPAYGNMGILVPTELVDHSVRNMEIDGVQFEFQYTPESEAPAEFTFYLPEKKAFCGAEVVSRTMHNLYTLRGAKVRDALKWSGYIDEAIERFGAAEVYFGSHHWPAWGNARVIAFLESQRDTYKFIHDQTLRMALEGMRPLEIADTIELPESLRRTWSSRGYYGTLRHNSRAVYQAYFGWYDANPAHLNPLPPVQSATRYVAFMGGGERVLEQAQASFDAGEYRWVAEVLNHLVFAEPDNDAARALLARTYDQLGYQAESGPWRNVYLSAAYELRHGAPEQGFSMKEAVNMVMHTPVPRFLDAMAARLNGPEAEGKALTVKLVFTDIGESYTLRLENSVLHHGPAKAGDEADATLKLTKALYVKMALGLAGIRDTLFSDDLDIDGSRIDLVRFFALFEKPDGTFNIVTP